jgi:hypothetical protein
MNHLKYRDEQAQVLKHYCITVKHGCKGIFFSLPANICLLNWRHPHQTYAHIYIDVALILDSAKISHQIHAAPPDSCHHHSDLEGIRTCAIQQEKAKCNNNNHQQIEKEAEQWRSQDLKLGYSHFYVIKNNRIPRLKM